MTFERFGYPLPQIVSQKRYEQLPTRIDSQLPGRERHSRTISEQRSWRKFMQL
jgi:hypothetical protein